MNIKPIHTEADHKAALAEIERLWDAEPGTPRHEKFEVLATLVDAYERVQTPILPPDPVEAIKFRMDQQGLSRRDLLPVFGTAARVSEILSGKRGLSIDMIRKLHERFGIPLESLVAPPVKKKTGGAKARPRHRGRHGARDSVNP